MEEKRGRNWRAKYLTKADFEQWKTNEFRHFVRLVWIILGAVIIIPTAFFIAIAQLIVN